MAPSDRSPKRLGTRVRALRQKEGLTQVEFARRLGISASYLNLIEHNQRSLTAPLLLKIAEELHVDLQDFSDGRDDDLAVALVEVLSDPMFTEHGVAPGQVQKQLSAPGEARAVSRPRRGLEARAVQAWSSGAGRALGPPACLGAPPGLLSRR